jgi:hypothetical protein
MTTDRWGLASQPPERRDDADLPVRVITCSRIGLQANPPARRLTIGSWLRGR